MFVQAPALLVQQKSENSEEGSDEEGTGDVLQVYSSFAFWPFYFIFSFVIIRSAKRSYRLP